MMIVMSLGFGPRGIVAGKFIHAMYCLMLSIHRLDCSRISVFHVWWIYTGWWNFCYINEHGNAGHVHAAVCDIRISNCDWGIDNCMEIRGWTMRTAVWT